MKLTTVEQVQKRVGKLPAPRDLKVIDHLDKHAVRWLSYASVAFLGFGNAGDLHLTIAGGERGFATTTESGDLRIPLDALDDTSIVTADSSFGALLMVNGMAETLRVNGRVSTLGDGYVTLAVDECYLHCAKSIRRSDFWSPQADQQPVDVPGFMSRSVFLVLATVDANGQVDVSPRGDPAGYLLQDHDGQVCFADRPGNRRVDSFRNILEQPGICVLAMIPGRTDILELRGPAELRTDETLLQRFEIKGKLPKLVTRVDPAVMQVRPSAAIAAARLWPAQEGPADLVPSEIFKAHMKQSNDQSLGAKVARAAISVPGAIEKGLELDYKKNLY